MASSHVHEPGTPESSPSLADERSRKRSKTWKEPGNGAVVHTGTRRKTACQSCRIRKVKCDAFRPVCAICKAIGAVCEYTDAVIEKLSLEAVNERLCERLDKLQRTIDCLQQTSNEHAGLAADKHERTPELQHHRSESRNLVQETSITESARDFLQIPAHKTTVDTILTWEVFGSNYAPYSITEVLFTPDIHGDERQRGSDVFTVAGGLTSPEDERIPSLVDNFLQNVHTKNPILDVESLVKQARRIAGEGLGWDAWSCLVLLACALGSVAKPFNLPIVSPLSPIEQSEASQHNPVAPRPAKVARELQQAESCFVLACRRLGGLRHTILGAQCHFFAGVYLMYMLRPLLAYQYFQQSSVFYQLYMKTNHGMMGDSPQVPGLPKRTVSAASHKQKRLEESLYWSCFKSESEFRVELPLPQTEIASYDHPQLFPSPPSPAGAELVGSADRMPFETAPTLVRIDIASSNCTSDREDLELRQHAKRLCNEEESWYYYLTEIALRRIGNRIINTFFRHQSHTAWLNVKPLLGIALEFDAQVSSWSAHLPPAMQHYETTYTIRAPGTGWEDLEDSKGNHVSRELSWAIDNRLLEMRSWLYQPFLYYLAHHRSMRTRQRQHHSAAEQPSFSGNISVPYEPQLRNNSTNRYRNDSVGSNASLQLDPRLSAYDRRHQSSAGIEPMMEAYLSSDDSAILHHMITSGIECNLKILDVRSLRHRHHGLWYDLRSLTCASLTLLAIIKSGHEAWIPGGVEVLWGSLTESQLAERNDTLIMGKLGHVLAQLEYWSAESPDMVRHHEVLEAESVEVRDWWLLRQGKG